MWWQAKSIDEALARICVSDNIERATQSDVALLLADLPCLPTWNVLEIGCGVGRLMKPLCSLFAEVHGVDTSIDYVKLSYSYLEGTQGLVLWIENQNLFIPRDYYDFVYSFLVFQHIRSVKVFKSYLSEVYQVLKSNGIFRFQLHDTSDPKFGRCEEDLTTVWGNVYTAQELYDLMLEFNYRNIVIQEQSPWIWVTANK
jgi:cyclopropane fatty-acyl-phospholipid synthase-like methyltransferase